MSKFTSASLAILLSYGMIIVLFFGTVRFLSPGPLSPANITTGFSVGFMAAFSTFFLALVAWIQLAAIRSTTERDSRRASADLILKLKRDFFHEQTRTLITLLANKWLRFVEAYDDGVEAEVPFFHVDANAIRASRLPEEIKTALTRRQTFTAFEMDDLVLGHLSDVAMLWETDVLNLLMIESMFGWYVEVVWESDAITTYVKNQRTAESPDMYREIERLYGRIKR